MTKYYYACEEDKKLVTRAFSNNALLLLGKKNKCLIEDFRKFYAKRVSNVNVFEQGRNTRYLSSFTPGICRLNENNNIVVEFWGYKGVRKNKRAWIKHEATHEFCHSFVDLLPLFKSTYPNGKVKDGIIYENHMGMIREMNQRTGKLVGQHYYGKMFNETMMDIITSMSINSFDNESLGLGIDDILINNYNDSGSQITSYSLFTSITRLAIAAFANTPSVDYNKVVRDGDSIFTCRVKMANGEIKRVNDFLYGIVYGQLHIEDEFDKFMGDGTYRDFCHYLDRVFLKTVAGEELTTQDVKIIMNVLPDFINKKMNYYRANKLLSPEKIDMIISNFNVIWNSMQEEYHTYFTQEDIHQIARRAGRL